MTDFPPLPQLRWFHKDRAYGYTETDIRAFREECCAYAASNTAALQSRLSDAEAERDALRAALVAIDQYGSDTISGPANAPDDRSWHRSGVLEMTRRARAATDNAREGKE